MTTQIPYSLADSNLPQGVRQTVQYSSVDANGLPNFVTAAAGGGLACDLSASAATPVIVSFSAGPDEYRARLKANVANAWSGLAASTTNYLYIDRNPTTGAITYGSTTLQDNYQSTAAPTTDGQLTFVIPSMTMYAGNGSAANAVQRIVVAEADTNASGVTAVRVRALKGMYDSGFIATLPGTGVQVSKSSNLGFVPMVSKLSIQNLTAENGYSIGDVTDAFAFDDPNGAFHSSTLVCSKNTIGFVVGATGAWYMKNKTTGSNCSATLANWAYRITASRGWGGA